MPGAIDDTVNCMLDVMKLETQPGEQQTSSLSMPSHTPNGGPAFSSPDYTRPLGTTV